MRTPVTSSSQGNVSGVTTAGMEATATDREAITGARPDHDAVRPDDGSTGRSYYGRPVIKEPTWAELDIAGYLFLGGLAGASSVLAAGASLAGRPALGRVSRLGAAGAIAVSLAALVHDLGRPARFVNMLRVFKPTSPMSVGSWLLAVYAPAAFAAAASEITGVATPVGTAAALGAGLLGPGVAAYTAALVANTAVPAWHEPHRELPFLFVGSAAAAAGGLGLLAAPAAESGPARRLAVAGAAVELFCTARVERTDGIVAEAYRSAPARNRFRAARAATVAGTAGALLAGRRRSVARAAGAALLAGSACTRFALFAAGVASARDPRYVVEPQRDRLRTAGGVPPGR